MSFRRDIQGLRGIAVLLVIFSHMGVPGFKGGFVGVDIFFVISGYLIIGLIRAEYADNAAENDGVGFISIREFYFRRIRRIVPMSLTVLLVTTLVAYLTFNATRTGRVFIDAIWAMFFAANIHIINQSTNYFEQGFATSPVQHYWSLAVEEQFYLFFPGLFLLTTRFHSLKIFKINFGWNRRAWFVIFLITMGSLIYSIIETTNNPNSAYFSTISRFWEIGTGGLIALSTQSGKYQIRGMFNISATVIGAVAIIFSATTFSGSTVFPGLAATVPVLGAALIIWSGISEKNLVSRILSTKILETIGKISYSLYLWHWPLIIFLNSELPNFLSTNQGKIAYLAVVFVLSGVSFKLIEQPFSKLRFPERRWKSERVFSDRTMQRLSINFSRSKTEFLLLLICFCVLIVGISRANNPDISKSDFIKIASKNTPTLTPTPSPTPTTTIGSARPNLEQLEANHTKLLRDIRLSLTEVKVPDNIFPTLKMLTSRLGYQSDLCRSNFCQIGAGPETITIVGNSFAQMILPIVAGAFPLEKYNINLHWSSGCQIAEISKCPDIFNISSKTKILILSDYSYSRNDFSLSDVQLGLRSAYSAYAKYKIPTVVFGEPVFHPTTLIDCIDRQNLLTEKCFVNLRGNDVSNQFKKTLAAENEFYFIDPNEWICLENKCPLVIGSSVVYVDRQHLESNFSKKYLSSEFLLKMITMGLLKN